MAAPFFWMEKVQNVQSAQRFGKNEKVLAFLKKYVTKVIHKNKGEKPQKMSYALTYSRYPQ